MKKHVLLCSHNGENFIKDQILSIINQEEKIDYIHIFDFASTDTTYDQIIEIKETHKNYAWNISKINHAPGPAASFFYAIKKVSPLISSTDFILLAADLTGLPVISTIIESLSAKTKGIVCVEVPTENDIHTIETKANLEFKWIVNPAIGNGTALHTLVKMQNLPKRKDGKRFAYVAGESKSIKEIKSFFKDDLEWKKDEFYCTSHWKAGKAEKNALEDCHDKIEQELLVKVF